MFRDGLVVAFLTFHPIRRRNIASIGREIVSRGDTLALQLSTDDTKNRRPHDAVVAPKLSDAIRIYLSRYRPVLLQARGRSHAPAGNAFWISHDGSPCTDRREAHVGRWSAIALASPLPELRRDLDRHRRARAGVDHLRRAQSRLGEDQRALLQHGEQPDGVALARLSHRDLARPATRHKPAVRSIIADEAGSSDQAARPRQACDHGNLPPICRRDCSRPRLGRARLPDAP
jgi:hypothetical protein